MCKPCHVSLNKKDEDRETAEILIVKYKANNKNDIIIYLIHKNSIIMIFAQCILKQNLFRY